MSELTSSAVCSVCERPDGISPQFAGRTAMFCDRCWVRVVRAGFDAALTLHLRDELRNVVTALKLR